MKGNDWNAYKSKKEGLSVMKWEGGSLYVQ